MSAYVICKNEGSGLNTRTEPIVVALTREGAEKALWQIVEPFYKEDLAKESLLHLLPEVERKCKGALWGKGATDNETYSTSCVPIFLSRK